MEVVHLFDERVLIEDGLVGGLSSDVVDQQHLGFLFVLFERQALDVLLVAEVPRCVESAATALRCSP